MGFNSRTEQTKDERLTTNATRTRLSLFGDRASRNQDAGAVETKPATPAGPTVTNDAIAAIRASFSEKRCKARRNVHIVP